MSTIPPLPRRVKEGDRGADVYVYKRALRREERLTNSEVHIQSPVSNNVFGSNVATAVKQFQHRHRLRVSGEIGPHTYVALWHFIDAFGRWRLAKYRRAHSTSTRSYPLDARGPIIQRPYEGTHLLFGNWESDNAIDIEVPVGTVVKAVRAGVIGSQIGPLDPSNPLLAGQRLHLVTADDELYYAHLRQIDVVAFEHVQAGQRLGLSGSANNVAHLHFACHIGDPGAKYAGSPSPGYRDRHLPG